MSTYTTEPASVPFFAIQPQRSRAVPPPFRPQNSPNMPSHASHHNGNNSSHHNGGGSSPFALGAPPLGAQRQAAPFAYGPHTAPPPPPSMGMYPPAPYTGMPGSMNGPMNGSYGPQPASFGYGQSQPPHLAPSVHPGAEGRFHNNNNNNNNNTNNNNTYASLMPPPLPCQSHPPVAAAHYAANNSTSWLQDQTPTKGRSLNHLYDEPSMLSGTTPAGLSTSRLRESRLIGSRLGLSSVAGGTSPSLSLSPQQAYSGVALEKDLLQAHKDELVQILLELASCDVAASSFIHTKARFFAFRRDVAQDSLGDDEVGRPRAEGPIGTDAAAPAMVDGDVDLLATQPARSPDTTTAASRPHKATAVPEDDVEEADDEAVDTSAIHADTSRLLFSAADTPRAAQTDSPLPRHPSHRPSPSRTGHHESGPHTLVRTGPESRPFVALFHPCLRWYGTCRNPTSCVYVALPQNVCLNWVRGACAAATECSGAHRLPDTCPPEVLRIYELCHGLVDRHGVRTTPAESSATRSRSRPAEASVDGPHTPRQQVLSHPHPLAPPAMLAPHTTLEEVGGDCPERAVDTASPSRLASCSEDTLEALLEQGLRPALQTSSGHFQDGEDGEDGEENDGAPPVFRCLNDSFARAAEQTSDGSNTSH